jgi:hypothetical protein
MQRAWVGALFLAVAGALSWGARFFPEAIEHAYARRLYPTVVWVLSSLSGLVRFSLAELAVGMAALGLLLRLGLAVRDAFRQGLRRSGAALLGDLVLLAGVLALSFVLLWGLNYQRQPLAVASGLDARPAAAAELAELAEALVLGANTSRDGLPEDGQGVLRAPDGTAGILDRTPRGFDRVAPRYPALAGRPPRPKPVFLSEAMSWLGLSGIYSPFTGEANVNTTAPIPALPFTAAHETAHQRGLAREDEANFGSYLACLAHPDPDFRYSGLLAASLHTSAALRGVDEARARDVEALRSPAVGRDLQALREWEARHEGPVARTAEKVNDAYLKSQGAMDGVRSYGRMVDLLLAERRAQAGRPAPRE